MPIELKLSQRLLYWTGQITGLSDWPVLCETLCQVRASLNRCPAESDIHTAAWSVNANRSLVDVSEENITKVRKTIPQETESSPNNTHNVSQRRFLKPSTEGCVVHAPSGVIPEREAKLWPMRKTQTDLFIAMG